MSTELPSRRYRQYRKINLRSMTPEQRRAYNNEAQRKSRLKARLASVKEMRAKPKPEEWCCRLCGVTKPFTEDHFYRSPEGLWGLNKQCRRCVKDLKSARKFGITITEYKQLTTGRCAICDTETKLVLDHCHTSGNIRAGLCNPCNVGLGVFRDDPETLDAAAAYLRLHQLLG